MGFGNCINEDSIPSTDISSLRRVAAAEMASRTSLACRCRWPNDNTEAAAVAGITQAVTSALLTRPVASPVARDPLLSPMLWTGLTIVPQNYI